MFMLDLLEALEDLSGRFWRLLGRFSFVFLIKETIPQMGQITEKGGKAQDPKQTKKCYK